MDIKDYVDLIESIRVENPNLKKYVDKLVVESIPNFWEIIEYGNTKDRNMRSAHEIRYSRFIKWLLDPTENHRLGHLFIRELLKSVEDINISNKEILSSFSDDSADIIVCQTEYKNIDVYYYNKDKQIQVAIEVKQYSSEHNSGSSEESQLTQYSKVLDERFGKQYKFFLTPDGDEPSIKNQDWISIDYKAISRILDSMIANNHDLDFIKLVKDFRADLLRTVTNVLFTRNQDELRLLTSKNRQQILSYEPDDLRFNLEFKQAILESNLDEKKIVKTIEVLQDNIYKQNHNKSSEEVKKLINKLFDYYSGCSGLMTDYQKIIDDLSLSGFVKKSKKGQNLTFISEKDLDRATQIYIAGDSNGVFPAVFCIFNRNTGKWSSIKKELKLSSKDASSLLLNDNFQNLIIQINTVLNRYMVRVNN